MEIREMGQNNMKIHNQIFWMQNLANSCIIVFEVWFFLPAIFAFSVMQLLAITCLLYSKHLKLFFIFSLYYKNNTDLMKKHDLDANYNVELLLPEWLIFFCIWGWLYYLYSIACIPIQRDNYIHEVHVWSME